ncbi:MAG: DUF4834 domain-containing protein [Alistipes sp.]|nr:DUF4834 domain-containing protein [Alistipes sp.]MDE5906500.1 DUF4834 domain-containing protein [Alistipes sp.]
MRFFAAIIEALAAFVQRNPLTVLFFFVLALVAPSLFKGIAAFILYAFMGIVLLFVLLGLLFRWRIYRLQRDMEKQFGRGFRPDGEPAAGRRREGDVKVHRTAGTPEKRVSSDVGDYVDFEETGEKE